MKSKYQLLLEMALLWLNREYGQSKALLAYAYTKGEASYSISLVLLSHSTDQIFFLHGLLEFHEWQEGLRTMLI